MHRLLKRQIKKFVSREGEIPEDLGKFVSAVNEAYDSYDSDRIMLERSLELSSTEMGELNRGLRKQTTELEASLKQIREMKDQLVVQEKMASLGSLTAGIAHEIKNPLNFITNFADLSVELLDELKEGIEGPDIDREDVDEVMGMLSSNLSKILEHGKRADSIVRGMLLHSRGAAGERTTADLNELLDEYVNLAYHGMRAKNVSFNVTLERHFGENLGNIQLVPQDMSRVFLNLINNACYATQKRAADAEDGYEPTVTVTTRREGSEAVIEIRDNGIGMPKDVAEKVFSPFFTTKPPGEGTGLGLSITYDIVVQMHQGSISVESVEGQFTCFTVRIPYGSDRPSSPAPGPKEQG